MKNSLKKHFFTIYFGCLLCYPDPFLRHDADPDPAKEDYKIGRIKTWYQTSNMELLFKIVLYVQRFTWLGGSVVRLKINIIDLINITESDMTSVWYKLRCVKWWLTDWLQSLNKQFDWPINWLNSSQPWKIDWLIN